MRRGRVLNFVQTFKEDLPCAAQCGHRKFGGERGEALVFVFGFRDCADFGEKMREIEEVLNQHERVAAGAVHFIHDFQRFGHIAGQCFFEKI